MKKLTIALATGLVSMSGWSACTYDFNATQAQIDTYNSSHSRKKELMTTINTSTQEGISVIKLMGNPTIDQVLASATTLNGIPDKNVVNNGIIAFEVEIDTSQLQSLLAGSTQEIQQMGFVVAGSSASGMELGIQLAQALVNNSPPSANGNQLVIVGGSYQTTNGQIGFKDIDPRSFPIQVPSNGKVRFGVYINQQSKQLGFIVNGVNYGYMNVTANNPITKIGFFAESQAAPNANSKFIGKPITFKLITDSTKMTQTYPTGAKDVCGNTI